MADDSSTEKLRLFVAIPMPETVRNEIIGVQQELQRLVSRDAVRWTKPEQFHLTLRFLGDVPVERVSALQEAVNAVCRGSSALHLRAQGVGFFPNARSPRVVWAGVNDGEGRLADLQKKIEGAVGPFAEKPSSEKFAGHVTIGRVKFLKQPDIENLAAHAQAIKDRLFGEWTANEVELIRSDLLPTGAQHSLLAAIHLKM
ncbi:MAG: RNA 2',3'-cyclic phosphodiesterase [Verrucomicrobiota bacterium]|jgi:2'-5' RNA ligase